MARAHFVKKAQKNNPAVKKGESYYWWAFMQGGRGGPKHYSKTAPRQSQLTQSDFLSQIYSLQEEIEDLRAENYLEDRESLKGEVEDIISQVRELGEEQDEKKNNMPDSLQESETGELLANRAEECENFAQELEQVDLDDGDIEEAIDELQQASYQGE